MGQLEKTEETLQKEARIAELEKDIKKKRSTIKSLRTRLQKLEESIRNMMTKTSGSAISALEKIFTIKTEFRAVVEKVLAHKKILKTKTHREAAEEYLASFDESPEEEAEVNAQYEEFKQFMEEGPQETREEPGGGDPFAAFRQEVTEEEQQDIRKVYLKLSRAFHPDKATNKAEEELFHERMQQIGEAYRQHDIETLLRMERQFLEEAFVDLPVENNLNFLDGKIERLERELDFLEKQAKRISKEIKGIRKSEMGQQLTDFDAANRYGFGFDAQNEMMEEALEAVKKSQEIFEEALKKGKMTAELEAELFPEEEEIDLGELGELLELFGLTDVDGDPMTSLRPDKAPKFDAGETVIFDPRKNAMKHYPPGTPTEGIVVVDEIEWEGKYGYWVFFDKEIIENFPTSVVDYWLENEMEYGWIFCRETDLKPLKKGRIDVIASKAAGREAMYKRLFKKSRLAPSRRKRLNKILLHMPYLSDRDNWTLAFQEIEIPKKKQFSLGMNYVFGKGKKVVVLNISGYDEEEGSILLMVKSGRTKKPELCPIHYLEASGDDPFSIFVNDFKKWREIRFGSDDLFDFF